MDVGKDDEKVSAGQASLRAIEVLVVGLTEKHRQRAFPCLLCDVKKGQRGGWSLPLMSFSRSKTTKA